MKDMSQELFKMQFLMFWFIAFVLVLIFDRIARNKLGTESPAWKRVRDAKSVSLMLITIPVIAVGILYVLGRLEVLMNSNLGRFTILPFFIVAAYFPTKVFQELKRKREMEWHK